jgi:hypothetical protein
LGGLDRTVLINRADLKGSPFYELTDSKILKFHDLHYVYKKSSCRFFCYLILCTWKGFHQNLVMIFSHSSSFLFNFILFSKSMMLFTRRLVIKNSFSGLSINVPLNVRPLQFLPIIFLKLYNPVSYRPNQSNDVKKPTPTAQFKVGIETRAASQ